MNRLRPHSIAFAVLIACVLCLHSDFAAQHFYSDDFMFLLDSRDFAWGQFLHDVFSSPGNSEWNYWRPGLRLSLAAMHSVFGLYEAAYMAAGIGLHLLGATMVYAVVFSTTRSSIFGVLAGALLLSAPATIEAVTWMVCSFGVVPAAIALFAAGWCFIVSLETERRDLYAVAVALTCVSLTFREPAYQMPFVVLGIGWIHDRRVGRALVLSLPFVALTVFHFTVLNEISSAGTSFVELIQLIFVNEAQLIRTVFGVSGPDWLILAGFCSMCAVGLRFGDQRGRAMIWWSLFAFLPYIAKEAAQRHTYVFHICFAVGLAAVLAHVSRSSRRGRLLAYAAMVALLVANVVRLPEAQRRQRGIGEQSQRILDWSREQDLGRFDLLIADFVPASLENGWSAMLSLYLGLDVEVYPNISLPRPPFQILLQQDIDVGAARVGYLHFNPATQVYAIVPKSAMFGDRIPVPIFSVVEHYEVVAQGEALQRVVSGGVDLRQTVLVETAPPVPFEPMPGGRVISMSGWPQIDIDVEAVGPCYLLICLPARLHDLGKLVTVNGELVTPVAANGVFDAVLLEQGRHVVRVR